MRLRRSDPNRPGYTRRRRGRGFSYYTEAGEPLTDAEELARIRGLVIPPAWQRVWICPDPRGHIQAVGVDAAGRRQYRYHDVWRIKRDAAKFDHVLQVGRRLPRIRQRVDQHLRERGLTRNRVMAAAVRLLDLGGFRIGGEEYASGDEATFGLATLLCEHVSLGRGAVRFSYPGKGGARHELEIRDRQVRTVVRALLTRTPPHPKLLAYRNASGWYEVRSKDINDYLSEIGGGIDISAKDFRTWHGTVLAAVALATDELSATTTGNRVRGKRSTTTRKRAVRRAMNEVADYLGNTPAVARASYVDPRVVDLFLDGATIAPALDADAGVPVAQRVAERALLELLEEPARRGR